jgi:hypothetical protein
MDEFSITRPEPATPATDTVRRESGRGDARRRRPSRAIPEPAIPEQPTSGDDEVSHQVDELA